MRKFVYYVAITLDNYIAREDGSIDGFIPEGDHIPFYLESLQDYDTVVMGRSTYEFGYQYGLQPGQPAYPHMRHYIFSKTLDFPPTEQVRIVKNGELEVLNQLKSETGTDIYLCGGGQFAGFLLEHQLIDTLILKVNPIIFGKGIPLFGDSEKEVNAKLFDFKTFDNGVVFLYYHLNYLTNQ